MSSMLSNGAIVSTFKRTDSHTVRCRPTRKDVVVIYEGTCIFGVSTESHDFHEHLTTIKPEIK